MNNQALRRKFLVSMAVTGVATLGAFPAQARVLSQGWVNASDSMTNRHVRVSVVDSHSGQALPIFGGRRTHVGGEAGLTYKLRVENLTNRRLLVVASVDGVNVLTGQTAASHQSGYILEPRARVMIDGWRKSLHEVAQFVLTESRGSYASQTGRPDNVGVIGFAIFEEAAPPVEAPYVAPAAPSARQEGIARDLGIARGESRMAEKAAPFSADASNLGTGHGSRQASTVRRGEFERASPSPVAVLALHYDSLRNLEEAGIAQRMRWERRGEPSPFPGDSGFVPDPPPRRW